MSKEDLVAAVLAMEPATKAARVRDVLPAIEQKVAEGVRIADIVDTLSNAGLELTVGTLKSYLSRHRRRPAKAPRPSVKSEGHPVYGRIPCGAVSPNPMPESQRVPTDAAQATMAAGGSDADRGPWPVGPDRATSVPAAADLPHLAPLPPAPSADAGVTGARTARTDCNTDPEIDDPPAPLHGSGSTLSVHEALIAARKRVAATDYSKFARRTNQGKKSK